MSRLKGRLVKGSLLAAVPALLVSGTVASAATHQGNQQFKGQIVISIPSEGAAGNAAFKALAAAYHNVQPGVKLVWEPIPQNADTSSWLGTQLAAGTPRPDIVPSNYVSNYSHYVNLYQYQYTTNPYTGHLWNDDYNWKWGAAAGVTNGNLIMLPTQAVHIEFFYNKSIFNKLGLTPPKTWDQLVKVLQVIKQEDPSVIPLGAQFQIGVGQWTYEVYTDQYQRSRWKYAMAKPGDYDYNPQMNGKFSLTNNFIETSVIENPLRFLKAVQDGQIRMDTPQTTAMINNLKQAFPAYAEPGFYTATFQDVYDYFIEQKEAIMLDASWDLSALTNDMTSLKDPHVKGTLKPFSWGTFNYPSMTGPLVEAPARSVESAAGEYLGVINKNQDQTNMDIDFMKFWLSKPGYQAWVNGAITTGQFAPAGPIEIKGVTLPARYQRIINTLKLTGNAENGITTDTEPGPNDLNNLGFLYMQQVLSNKLTPQQFGHKLESLWQKNMNEIVKGYGFTLQDLVDPARAPSGH